MVKRSPPWQYRTGRSSFAPTASCTGSASDGVRNRARRIREPEQQSTARGEKSPRRAAPRGVGEEGNARPWADRGRGQTVKDCSIVAVYFPYARDLNTQGGLPGDLNSKGRVTCAIRVSRLFAYWRS